MSFEKRDGALYRNEKKYVAKKLQVHTTRKDGKKKNRSIRLSDLDRA